MRGSDNCWSHLFVSLVDRSNAVMCLDLNTRHDVKELMSRTFSANADTCQQDSHVRAPESHLQAHAKR